MCSTLPGDSPARSCYSYCHSDRAGRHCLHCTCASCPFCTARASTATNGRATLFNVNLSRAAVAETRHRFLGSRGVVLRLWECSLVGCLSGGNSRAAVDPFLQNCVRHETHYGGVQSPPASLLRWDVPAAIFAGGRCVQPAGTEWELYPQPAANADPLQRMDRDGWQPTGFVGHNATSMGVGWVLGDLPRVKREAAFAHDAWTASSHKSGTWDGAIIAPCPKQPNATRWQPTGPGGREYAKARYLAMHASTPRRDGFGHLQKW